MNTFTLRYELIDRRYSRGIRCRNVSNLEDGKIVYTFKKYFWKRIFRRRAKAVPFRTENTFPISRNSTYLHTVPTFDAQLHPTFSSDKVTLTCYSGRKECKIGIRAISGGPASVVLENLPPPPTGHRGRWNVFRLHAKRRQSTGHERRCAIVKTNAHVAACSFLPADRYQLSQEVTCLRNGVKIS